MVPVLLGAPLRPAHARTWPEEPLPFANVLCEGPSVLEARPEDLLPGPVLAVNHAIALSSTLPVDCWATVDDPRNLWEWGREHLHRTTKLLSTENNLPVWHRLIGMRSVNRRLYASSPVFMEAVPETGEGYIGEDGKPPLLPTVVHALGWLRKVGARHVRLFGCDMGGQGSPLSPIPYREEASEQSNFRWGVERALIGLSMKHYRREGLRLERWKQEGR